MRILSIETSCDETAIALVECKGTLRGAQGDYPKFRIIKNEISSQILIHRPFGGVVPNLAKREHIKNLPLVLKKVLKSSKISKPDMIAVTVGPGLEPALWTGIEFAKQLHSSLINANQHQRGSARIKNLRKSAKPLLVGVNHMEGHLYSFLAGIAKKTAISNDQFLISKLFPAIALVVSGGHTILLAMQSLTKWKKLGETRDDAAGEAFDKVARMLKLPYPGGPEISKLAERGNPKAINFPRPMINDKSYDFSFSGLKTAVLYYLRDKGQGASDMSHVPFPMSLKKDVAASFEQAIIDVLVKKTIRAVQEYGAKSVILAGGVAANKLLRETLKRETSNSNLNFLVPPRDLNTDNAAMIGIAAYIAYLQKKSYPLVADANLNL